MKRKDFLSNIKININIKKSEPACMMCLPPKSLKGHKSLNGMLIHERIDCPKDQIYLFNDKDFKF